MQITIPRDKHRNALQRFRTDQELVSRLCLKILTKHGALKNLQANRAQRYVEQERQRQLSQTGRVRMLILKARQEGISTWVAGCIYTGCKLHTGRSGIVLADKLDRAATIFSIYERFERESPEIIARPQVQAVKRKELAWAGDSRIVVETAGDTEAGRGSTPWYAHLSEFAFWPYAQETLMGLLNAVPADGGEVYIESTANGIGGAFHEMWEAAEQGESGWTAVFLPWWIDEGYAVAITEAERSEILASPDPWERQALDTGHWWQTDLHRLTPEQLAFRRRKIADDFGGDERRWRQEYPATPEEAFIASGGAFFDQDALSALFRATRTITPDRRTLVQGKLSKAEQGPLRIYEWPKENAHYVIGADTAEGRQVKAQGDDTEQGGRDYSVADVLKVSEWVEDGKGGYRLEACRQQVAQYHGRMAPEVFAEGVYALGLTYACRSTMAERDRREPALVVVERNHSSGQTTIRWLRDHDYPRLYRKRQQNVVGDKRPTVQYGFLTDQGSRRMVLDAMAEVVRLGVSGIASADTVRECRTFVLNDVGKPEAQEGTHDDRVISYALALEGERWHHHPTRTKPVEPKRKPTPTGV